MGVAVDNLVVKLAWSEEAREAALEARRAHPVSRVLGFRNIMKLHKELDAQGISPEHPIRGVVDYAGRYFHPHMAVARDADTGHIAGMAVYEPDRTLHQMSIGQMRVMNSHQGQGVGRSIITHIAQHTAEMPNSHKYRIHVYGAVENAKPFYEKTGATFEPWSHLGEWSPETTARLRAS